MKTKQTTNPLLARLRHHVSGAIARGEGEAIVEIRPNSPEAEEYNRDLKLRLRDNQIGSGMKHRP